MADTAFTAILLKMENIIIEEVKNGADQTTVC